MVKRLSINYLVVAISSLTTSRSGPAAYNRVLDLIDNEEVESEEAMHKQVFAHVDCGETIFES